MLLLTGATGLVGSSLLRRLVAEGAQVRCLVRDPRRLGAQRVRVQIALGDLADPPSFRNALRGVHTVVHLAASIRDQPQGSIEEINGIATWRMVEAAERSGAQRFLFFSTLGASTHHRARLLRAKALAEQAVRDTSLQSTVFAASIVYAPGDHWLALLERMALLPLMPVSGNGRALYQPIWAEDAADCVIAALRGHREQRTKVGGADAGRPDVGGADVGGADAGRAEVGGADAGRADAGGAGDAGLGGLAPRDSRGEEPLDHQRFELAGPDTLSHDEIVRVVLAGLNRSPPLLHVPTPIVSRTLRLLQLTMGPRAFATWDEAELMESPMISRRGAADVEGLGVTPQSMAAVLEAG
jgi:uncharacterized protein YbjT (DUF2867 family)